MRLPAFVLAAAVVIATLAVPGNARQQQRERLQPLRESSRPQRPAALPGGGTAIRDIAYGPHARQRYDLHLPANLEPGAPLLVMVHGGGWRHGDKRNPGVAGAKAAHWLAQGFVFVNVNYRLLPDADPLQQAADVAAAVASAQQRVLQAGANPKRTVLMGHSAGAHLVALLGSAPHLLARAGASRPRGVVPLDSAAMNVPEMMAKPRLPQLYHDAFGADPAFWTAASPFHQLDRRSLPMLIVCSSRRPDSCPQGHALKAKSAALGVPVQVLPEHLSHGEINHELGQDSAYTRAVSAWIAHLLAGDPRR